MATARARAFSSDSRYRVRPCRSFPYRLIWPRHAQVRTCPGVTGRRPVVLRNRAAAVASTKSACRRGLLTGRRLGTGPR